MRLRDVTPLSIDELREIARTHSCPVVRKLLWEIKHQTIESNRIVGNAAGAVHQLGSECAGVGSIFDEARARGHVLYEGALNGELFVELLKKMMARRRKPVHLVLDSLPAHKRAIVTEYVQSTQGKLTLHFLPGYAPDLNPEELAWSHVKRTGVARRPLNNGESLREKIYEQLANIQKLPKLIR